MIALGPVTDPMLRELSGMVGQRAVLSLRNGRVLGASGQAVIEKVDGDTLVLHSGGSVRYVVSISTIKKYVLVSTEPEAAIGRKKP